MSTQEFSNAILAQEALTEIHQCYSTIEKHLNFLQTLAPKEIQSIYKEGNVLAPFVDRAYQVTKDHPEIMPAIFNVAEFQRQYELSKDLTIISNRHNSLSNGLLHTLIKLNGNLLASALEVYNAVKINRDKIPGLNVALAEMAAFFKKTRAKVKAVVQKVLGTSNPN